VVVTNGAKQALFNIFQLLLEPGDEVIIPKPYWLSYPPMVTIPGGRPVYLERRAADHYILDADAAKPLITPRTRAIIINSPCNPTGVVHDLTSLQAIAKLAEKHNLICIFDDIYQQLTFDGRRWISPYVLKDIDPRRIIAVSGVSKSYAMTGFRIGWAIAAKEWSQSLAALQSHSTSSPATPSQWAAYAALSGPQDCIEQTRLSLQTKRDLVVATLPRLANIGCNPIQGAFYALLDCQAVLGSGRRWPDAHSLAMQLLEKAHVALVPGNDFGAPFALRLSFATSKENLTKGLERLVDWF
jgi:aspartate aminotransferase